ncbi:ubiquitin-like superfamily protein isoform X2 [Wolffia australiana]
MSTVGDRTQSDGTNLGATSDASIGYGSGVAKRMGLQSMLSALLSDPILSDVPRRPSLADVETLLSLELGSAMKISVLKMDGSSFDVAVPNSATVKDLKSAIRKKTEEMQEGQMGHRHISWRHVWANFCLSHNNEKLVDDDSLLQNFGVRGNSRVRFTPYVQSRVSQRHSRSRRRRHRFFHGLNKLSVQ